MFKKEHVIPFLIGWLIVAWILPPQRLLGGFSSKKA